MKYICLMFLLLFISGCKDEWNETTTRHGLHSYIFEITIDGKSHEYLKHGYGMCHYPECKYCKENEAKR